MRKVCSVINLNISIRIQLLEVSFEGWYFTGLQAPTHRKSISLILSDDRHVPGSLKDEALTTLCAGEWTAPSKTGLRWGGKNCEVPLKI